MEMSQQLACKSRLTIVRKYLLLCVDTHSPEVHENVFASSFALLIDPRYDLGGDFHSSDSPRFAEYAIPGHRTKENEKLTFRMRKIARFDHLYGLNQPCHVGIHVRH